MSKLHSYPWYPADWLLSETRMGMTLEERSIYRDLLDHCWQDGSLPLSSRVLASIAGASRSEWEKCSAAVLAQFEQRDGRLYHRKIDERRPDLVRWHSGRSEAGKKGAEKRWLSHSSAIDSATGSANGSVVATEWPSASTSIVREEEGVGEDSRDPDIAPEPPPPATLADQKTQAAKKIQAMLTKLVGSPPDLPACEPAAAEMIRFRLPLEKLRERIAEILDRERSTDPEWMPRSWGWAKTVVAGEARRLGKIHAGEVTPPDPPPTQPRPRKPQIITNATGGRIVGMSRIAGFKQIWEWRMAA